MKKDRNRLIVILTVLIFISFLALSIFGYRDYSLLIEGLTIEVTELYSENIKLEIERELTKPIHVAELISTNILLKGLAPQDKNLDEVTDYLQEIKQEYDYATTYFISAKTFNYYENDGTKRRLNPKLPEDSWVHEFIKKDIEYELHMKKRPSIADGLMLYINYAVKDGDKYLGIVGVGIDLNHIQDILASYSDMIEGSAFLSNKEGTVKIHSGPHPIDPLGIGPFSLNKDELFIEQEEANVFIGGYEDEDIIFASYYIESIDLFLIMSQDYDIAQVMILYQRVRTIAVAVIAFLLVAMLVIKITSHFHNKNIKLVNTDYLTNIYNRNAFDESLKDCIIQVKEKGAKLSLAIIDVDNFKTINDVHGHVIGDKILKNTAEHFKTFIRDKDIVARWGGDEFAIIFKCDLKHTEKILSRIKESVFENDVLSKYGTTFSIGITHCTEDDDIKTLLKRADEALYCAKDQGKDRICKS